MSELTKFLQGDKIAEKLKAILGTEKAAKAFASSALTVIQSNELLANATKESVYNSLLMAATLNLPLNANLGLAYIVPFNNKKKGVQEAQFQLGYKGYIQLAMRSNQFKTVSATPIYDGQIVSKNPLMGYEFDFSVKSNKVVGYAAYFKLINGFEKTIYQSIDDLKAHGLKYSQTYKKGFGVWNDNFEAMAIKTLLKLLLSKYAPLSLEMEKAIVSDSSVIEDAENLTVSYIDNQGDTIAERQLEQDIEQALEAINSAKTSTELEPLVEHLSRLGLQKEYDAVIERINNEK